MSLSYYQWRYTAGGLLEQILVSGPDRFDGKRPNYVVDDDQPTDAKCELRVVPKYGDQFPSQIEQKSFFCMIGTDTPQCCRSCWKVNFPGVGGSVNGVLSAASGSRTFYLTSATVGLPACYRTSRKGGYVNQLPYPNGVANIQFKDQFGSPTYSTSAADVSMTIYYNDWGNSSPSSNPGLVSLTQGTYKYNPASNGGRKWSCNGGLVDLTATLNESPSATPGAVAGSWPSQIQIDGCGCEEGQDCSGQESSLYGWNILLGTWQKLVDCPPGCSDSGPPSSTYDSMTDPFPFWVLQPCS